MSNIFKLCLTDFSSGGENFLRGLRPPATPLVTGLFRTWGTFVYLKGYSYG